MTKIILSIVILIATIAIHIYRAKGNKNYIKELFVGNSKGHVAYLDYFRVLATVLVIASHSMAEAVGSGALTPATTRILQIINAVTLCCDNMFFMISGALILNGGSDDENVFVFYRKRLLRILIPCFAYFTLTEILTYGTAYLKPDMWLEFIIRFFKNDSAFTPHFWMLLVIIILYLEAPIIRVGLQHMSERMLDTFVLAIFIAHGIYTFLPLFGFYFPYMPIIASYTSIFILGYYMTTDAAMKHYKTFMWGALISFIIAVVFIFTKADYDNYIYNNSPLAMFMTSAMFLFFRKHSEDIFSKTNAVIDILAKYSFSILMIHWYVLFILVKQDIGIGGTNLMVAGGVIVATLLTVIIGLAIAIVYDNTVVLVLKSIADWIIDFFVKIFSRRKDKAVE